MIRGGNLWGASFLPDFPRSQGLYQRYSVSDIQCDNLTGGKSSGKQICSRQDEDPEQNRQQKTSLSCLDRTNDLAKPKDTQKVRNSQNSNPNDVTHIITPPFTESIKAKEGSQRFYEPSSPLFPRNGNALLPGYGRPGGRRRTAPLLSCRAILTVAAPCTHLLA